MFSQTYLLNIKQVILKKH